jgi:protein-disulfide isomerase
MAKIKIKKEKVALWLSIISIVLAVISLVSVVTLSQKISALDSAAPAQAQDNQQAAAPAQNIDVGINPARGNKNAKVVIVAFSDYQCPYCSRVEPTMTQIEQTYGDKVAIYFRNFPLPPTMHPNAEKAAEAAQCANAQGKFWEMHDKLFANQGALAVDNLKQYAKDLGLDTTKFNTCLDTNQMMSVVQADSAAGQQAGVSGTPTTFVNGKAIVGAYPFDAFKAAIDAELAK